MSMKREKIQKVIERLIPASVVKEIQEVETLVITLDGPKKITKRNVSYETWNQHAFKVDKGSEVLSGFIWRDTPEGSDFWVYVETRLREIARQLRDNDPL